MKGRWAVVLLLVAAACGGGESGEPLPTAAPQEGVQVTAVVEGDSFDVLFHDGSTDRVRLLGIDVPDTSPESSLDEYGDIADRDCLKDWGELATEFATASMAGRDVTLIEDPAAGGRDDSGALLAYVEVDGRDFGTILVEQGLARAYVEGTGGLKRDYLASEALVRTSGVGLWSC
ncbi:MAG: thermonuclease family protein [Dehalococcoidia bacterium]|nr:thermonuclease family protein [Dehalococcoidia bacterium]